MAKREKVTPVASQQYKDRLLRAVAELPDDEAAKVVEFAESLSPPQAPQAAQPLRHLGFCRGQIQIDPSFFDPLPDEIIALFEGRDE